MENLSIIENEFMPVYNTSTGEKIVYAADLYRVLGGIPLIDYGWRGTLERVKWSKVMILKLFRFVRLLNKA